ncbi:exopolysaccharide transport family protein [Mesorhizobium sp. B2-1-8]|uniref:GumC family protein n=1 Tax=unclassified Mesorhizobium TaxID=325217 RepID=UPI00112DDC36|nr:MULTISPECIES: exopolysaccharide transport family protein [unclassified Mesorhizobium]TPI22382.1 exopolysaccharide biosynthesis protein [Mesorhizobium sp. B3-2-1]UCI16761.1 exopolysaccharide transport family protein [Mesorhizobium sp. B2-1-8]
MEGSVANRIVRAKQIALPASDTNTLRRRKLRERIDTPTPFHQLVTVIARRKWFVLAIAIFGGVMAGLAGIARPMQFEGTTQVIIDAPNRNAAAGATQSVQDLLDSSIDDHLTMLSSQANLRHVLAALGKTAAANGAGKSGFDPLLPDQHHSSGFLSDMMNRLWPRTSSGPNNPEALDAPKLEALRNRMRVGQELHSRVISIGYTDTDPVRAAIVANTIAQVYIQDLVQQHRASDQQELDSIVASLPRLQKDLVDATDRLETYRLTHGGVDQAAANNAADETAELSRQIALSKANFSATQTRLHHIQDLQKAGASASTVAAELGSPVLNDLINGKADPTAIDGQIEQETARLDSDTNVYSAQIAALEARKAVLDAVVADTASRLSGLRALEPQVAIATQHYNDLLGRQQDLIHRIAAPSPGVAILSAAWPPSAPKTLPPIFLIPPGMIVFGLLGAVFVLARNHFNKTLRSEAEAEMALDIPCVGLLPKVRRMHARELRDMVLGQQSSALSRAVMSLLVTVVPTQGRGRPPHLLLVTSSIRGDEKTELAWSLALAATRLGGRVLLLDLERKNTRLTTEFREEFKNVDASGSFGDYVSGRCTLQDAIAKIPALGVDLIVAPRVGDDLLAQLSTADSCQFADELRSIYAAIIVNGPLDLGGPETRLLTHWADTVLLTVRWAKTPRSLARAVVDLLQSGAAASVPMGSVLTQVNLKKHARYRFEDGADLLVEKT